MTGDRGLQTEDARERPEDQVNEEGVVREAGAVKRNVVAVGTATEMQVLVGPEQGAPNFVLRRFIMGAGGGMPRHTNLVEHEQYVLRGRARITIGDAVHEVDPDHTLFIPAGAVHSYEVLEAPFEFLCVVPNAPDRVTIVTGGAPPPGGTPHC